MYAITTIVTKRVSASLHCDLSEWDLWIIGVDSAYWSNESIKEGIGLNVLHNTQTDKRATERDCHRRRGIQSVAVIGNAHMSTRSRGSQQRVIPRWQTSSNWYLTASVGLCLQVWLSHYLAEETSLPWYEISHTESILVKVDMMTVQFLLQVYLENQHLLLMISPSSNRCGGVCLTYFSDF